VNRFFIAFIISINSGISFALLTSIFTTYLKDNNIDLVTIGILSLRMTPYSFKYLWAPIVEGYKINIFPYRFGQRKSWLLTMQFLLIILITSLSFINVKQNITLFCFLAFVISFISATYDIAMEAFRIELFEKQELNKGTFFNILGFRMGRVLTAAGGVYLSLVIDWQIIYLIIASLIIPCMFIIYFSKDSRDIKNNDLITQNFGSWFKKKFLLPFILLYRKKNFTLIMIMIAFYKLSDGYIDTMLIPFLIEIGHSKAEIATIVKVIGTGFTILGTLCGSFLISRFKVISNLLFAELFSALSNLFFITMVNFPPNNKLFTLVICAENFCSGICHITLIHYMSSLCSKRFTAIHYAILISIAGMTKNILSSSSGFIAITYGWHDFFLISAALSIPSVLCILKLRKMSF